MKIVGIDLATVPVKTAVCVMHWSDTGVCVGFRDGAADPDLIQVCRDVTVDKVGIDCPFGWPAPFVGAITAHALGQAWPGRDHPEPAAFAKTLAYRLTDIRVQENVPGALPLAVAADKLGKTAMRCALLLDALGSVDRSGRRGRVAEVYPAASLKKWKLAGLKPKDRGAILGQLEELMPTMEFEPGALALVLKDDNAFDALICAITARAVATGRTTGPSTDEEVRRAMIEGWIHVPTAGPDELACPYPGPG